MKNTNSVIRNFIFIQPVRNKISYHSRLNNVRTFFAPRLPQGDALGARKGPGRKIVVFAASKGIAAGHQDVHLSTDRVTQISKPLASLPFKIQEPRSLKAQLSLVPFHQHAVLLPADVEFHPVPASLNYTTISELGIITAAIR